MIHKTISKFQLDIFFDIHPRSVLHDLQTLGVSPLGNEFCLLRVVNWLTRMRLIYVLWDLPYVWYFVAAWPCCMLHMLCLQLIRPHHRWLIILWQRLVLLLTQVMRCQWIRPHQLLLLRTHLMLLLRGCSSYHQCTVLVSYIGQLWNFISLHFIKSLSKLSEHGWTGDRIHRWAYAMINIE